MSEIKKTDKHYLTGKEVRAIAKANQKEMRRLEKEKQRKKHPSEYTTQMKDTNNILEVENLHSYFFTDQGVVKAVNGVSFNIPANSTVGVVGESGCGKSVTSMSVMRLLQGPSGQIVNGEIRFKVIDYKRDEIEYALIKTYLDTLNPDHTADGSTETKATKRKERRKIKF